MKSHPKPSFSSNKELPSNHGIASAQNIRFLSSSVSIRSLLVATVAFQLMMTATLTKSIATPNEWPTSDVKAESSDLDDALAVLSEATGEVQDDLRGAWATVAATDRTNVFAILSAMDGANQLGVNWMATAIDAVFESENGDWGKAEEDSLVAFVMASEHSAASRKTALELLKQINAERAEGLIPEMVNDRLSQFRRPGVAQLIVKAEMLRTEGARKRDQLLAFQEALKYARDEDQVRTIISALDELGDPIVLADHFGFVRNWSVIGPFPNDDGSGFDRDYPPESLADAAALKAQVEGSVGFDGKEGKVQWTSFSADEQNGIVDLNKAISQESSGVGYGAAIIAVEGEQQVQLRMRVQNAFKIWLNGELIMSQRIGHTGNFFDQYQADVTLRDGNNLIVVKSCQTEPLQDIDFFKTWHFGVRVSDDTGAAFRVESVGFATE